MIVVLLISLVLIAAPARAQVQPPPPRPTDPAVSHQTEAGAGEPPYTLEGVRRAAIVADQPDGKGAQPADEAPEATPAPSRKLARSAAQQKIDIATWAPEPPPWVPRADDHLVTGSLAPAGPAWHREFLAMTTPAIYSPFSNMGNAERLETVASGAAFALGVEGATRLVQLIAREYRRHKVEELRRQIDAETALVEQRYREYLAGK